MNLLESAADLVRRHYELTWTPGAGRFAHAQDAQISPDGSRVVFAGKISDDLDAGARTHLGLAEDGLIRALTHGPDGGHHPRWSPDGQRIAFLSDRAETGRPQLLMYDLAAATVQSTPWIDGVVESLDWSGDGSSILLVVAGLDADQGDVRGPGRQSQGDAPSTPGWRPSVRSSDAEDRTRGIWIYDLARATVRRLTPPSFTVWEAVWCGPSAIVAVTSTGSTEGAWFDPELRWISAVDGADRVIHRASYQLGKPACSPSGTRIAVISGLCSDRGNVPGDVVLVDLGGGPPRTLDAAGTDVTDLTWLDDDRLAFIGVRGMETVAGVTGIAPTEASVTWASSSSCGRHIPRASFAPSSAMAVVQDSYELYPRITVVANGNERVAGALAPEGLDELTARSGSIEPVSWQAGDGQRIDGWLCTPLGPAPYPTVLLVHGGPVGVTTNAWDMGNDTTRVVVERGYAVLHPNPRGSYGRGQGFVHGVLADMGGADASDLLAGVDAMIAKGVADPARVAVIGTSYGGYMANLLPTITGRFAAAVAMSPVTDWASFQFTSNIPEFATLFLTGTRNGDTAEAGRSRSPITFAAKCRTPTLEVGGLLDLCTPFEQAARHYDALASTGTSAELVCYPEAGHGVQHLPAMIDLCARVMAWLDEHLAARSSAAATNETVADR